jgi:hypothetical protein
MLAGTLLLASGCLRDTPPPSDPELAEALGLPAGTPVHRVDLADRSGRIGLFPPAHRVVPGALVQFVTRDRRVYSIHFLREAMDPVAWAFLEETGQASSPPLVEEGARFVLTFEGAPEASYPFEVRGQGEAARGQVTVAPPRR